MEKFRVVITKLDTETGESEELMDQWYKSVCMLNSYADEDAMTELMMNDSIMGLAMKIASSRHFRRAAMLATTLDKIKESAVADCEGSIISAILGTTGGRE